jgi:hypothetical protein
MNIMHSILTELGVTDPTLHASSEQHGWIVGDPFDPIAGKSYEVRFGDGSMSAVSGNCVKKLRIDSINPEGWFDLEEGKPLAADLRNLPVEAFRPLEPE